MKEVLGHVMVLLQEHHQPREVLCGGHHPEHLVSFPPPVMLGLSELSLSVVTVDIRPGRVTARYFPGSDKINVRYCQIVRLSYCYTVIYCQTVILSGEITTSVFLCREDSLEGTCRERRSCESEETEDRISGLSCRSR